MASKEKLWTRSFIVLMGVNFSSALSVYLILVEIAEYVMNAYGVPIGVAGFAVTAYVVASLLSRMFLGGKIDQWGLKRSIIIGSVINVIGLLLYMVPMGFIPLICVRALHGVGFALVSGSTAAAAALVIPRARNAEGIGYFSMMQALATGIGPFIAILLVRSAGGYMAMFLFAAIVSVLSLISVFFLAIPDQGAIRHIDSLGNLKRNGIGALIQLPVVPIVAVMFLIYMGYACVMSFVTVYASESGLDGPVSVYFVIYAAVVLISRPPLGRRVDRYGENSTIYYCFIAFAAGMAALAFAVNGALLLLSAALLGIGVGATQSIIQAVIARDTPPHELGKANSTFLMGTDLGVGAGPILIGPFIPVIGYRGGYLVLMAVGVLAALVYYAVHGRKQESRR